MLKSQRSGYTPLDFHGWHENNSLVLSPKFQRRQVWSASAKSYLIDSLLRGMPVPPIYLRVRQSDDKKKTVREVVDGQQRISTVIEYLNNEFALRANVGEAFRGKKFSQLPSESQEQIRAYSFICEVLQGLDDTEVLQIFRRLNMYSVPLNAQELRNGRFFGQFKESAYLLGEEHLAFWRHHRVFSDQKIARMAEVEFTSELMIMLLHGLQDKKKSIDSLYAEYDEKYPLRKSVERQIREVLDIVNVIFPEGLRGVGFNRTPLLYSLIGAISHRLYGVPKIKLSGGKKRKMTSSDKSLLKEAVIKLSQVMDTEDQESLRKKDLDFYVAATSQTDNIAPRTIRLNRIFELAFG
jgi:uncharacterized protein DUF262